MRNGKVDYVTVYYTNGERISTSMNPNLSDVEIKNYFRVGERMNIGNGEYDRMTTIKKVVIHRRN